MPRLHTLPPPLTCPACHIGPGHRPSCPLLTAQALPPRAWPDQRTWRGLALAIGVLGPVTWLLLGAAWEVAWLAWRVVGR